MTRQRKEEEHQLVDHSEPPRSPSRKLELAIAHQSGDLEFAQVFGFLTRYGGSSPVWTENPAQLGLSCSSQSDSSLRSAGRATFPGPES